MFHVVAARVRRRRPSVLISIACLPLLTALAVAGTSSASPSKTPHANTSTTNTTMSMTTTTSMGSGGSGATGGSMRGKAAPHAELVAGTSKHYGTIVYDKDHLVLYEFSGDRGTTSRCYGACANAWPPMLTKGKPMVAGLSSKLIGTTRRRDGSLQVTYGGHPLYYWSGDTARTIMCQHVKLHGGWWYVVKPSGAPNKAMGVGTMGMM